MPVNACGVDITTSARIAALASTNSTLLKAGYTQAYTVNLYNNAAYAVFLKLYNKATAPTVGTDTPVLTIGIPATATGAVRDLDLQGMDFTLGLGYAITKLVADSDTTVVVANDLVGVLNYQ